MTFLRRRQRNALETAQRAGMRIGPAEPIVAPIAVVWAEPPASPPVLLHGQVRCPQCSKPINKRGAHFHVRSCKGAA